MADEPVAATAQPEQGAAQEEEAPPRPAWSSILFQLAIMYMMWNFAFTRSPAAPVKPTPAAAADEAAAGGPVESIPPQAAGGTRHNLWSDGQSFDLRVYTSVDEAFSAFASNDALLWEADGLTYDWREENERSLSLNFTLPAAVLANQTLYAHVFATKEGFSPDPSHPSYHPQATIYRRHEMTRHMVKKAGNKKRHLLGGGGGDEMETAEGAEGADAEDAGSAEAAEAASAAEPEADTVQLYWKPTLDVRIVHDFTALPASGWPLEDAMLFDPHTGHYFPTLLVNEFWVLKEHLVEVNGSLSEAPLELSYNTFGQLKWQLQHQMVQSWQMQADYGAASDRDTDEFKRMLLETNPYLLVLTGVVSALHMAFEFLAFKNDIQFWNKRKSMEGLSVRTLFMSLFFQVVITLYLFDNDTSWMILISSALESVMSFWKISKAVKLKWVNWRGRQVPWFQDRVSYAGSETKQFDEEAMRHLMLMLYPMVAGTALYSLVYNQHKSWYSWVISSLVSFIYVFGFIRMTPQLYINYRLQSVAHMPWRAMMYKSLNTVIDDLFAFIVTMPLMHRLACFRDDLIFVIYLYQRWIYRVDPTRVNEYGQSGTDDAATAADVAASAPAISEGTQQPARLPIRPRRSKLDRR